MPSLHQHPLGETNGRPKRNATKRRLDYSEEAGEDASSTQSSCSSESATSRGANTNNGGGRARNDESSFEDTDASFSSSYSSASGAGQRSLGLRHHRGGVRGRHDVTAVRPECGGLLRLFGRGQDVSEAQRVVASSSSPKLRRTTHSAQTESYILVPKYFLRN